jgi:hypothetical protein
VTDFEVLMGPDSESFALPFPLSCGRVRHPLLDAHDVTMKVPMFSRSTVILGGKGSARVELSNGSEVQMARKGDERRYTWNRFARGARLVVSVMVGVKPLDVV